MSYPLDSPSIGAAQRLALHCTALRDTIGRLAPMEANALQPAMNSVRYVAESLPPSVWEGGGGDAFRHLTNDTVTDLNTGINALAIVRSTLSSLLTVYEQADYAAKRHLRALLVDEVINWGMPLAPGSPTFVDAVGHIDALDAILAEVSIQSRWAGASIRAAAAMAPKHSHWASAPLPMNTTSQPSMANPGGAQLGYLPTVGNLFSDSGPSAADIQQGPLGDCYLLAAAAALAQNTPWVLSNRIIDNGNGTYTVTMKGPSDKDVSVVVDAQIPYTLNGPDSAGLPYSAGVPVVWPIVLEKAYADIYGANSYDNIAKGGWPAAAMKALTGQNVIVVNTDGLSQSLIPPVLASATQHGYPVTASTGFNAGDPATAALAQQLNVVNDHAYYVTGYDAATGMVHLGNPWGVDPSITPKPLTLDQFYKLYNQIALVK